MTTPIVGVGILLKANNGDFLFQERDYKTNINPGMIAPFGGGIDKGETPAECAVRELEEELGLVVTESQLKDVGIFQSHIDKEAYIQIYLIKNVQEKGLVLKEGKSIKKLSLEQASAHPKVTNFAKRVLRAFVGLNY